MFEKNKAVSFEVHNTCASEAEKRRAEEYYEQLINDPVHFPCSFKLDGVSYNGFTEEFKFLGAESGKVGEKRTNILKFRHESGLVFRILCGFYPNYAAFEWTMFIKNENMMDGSPQISKLCVADLIFAGNNPHLRGIKGDALYEEYDDTVISPTGWMNYQPYDIALLRGVSYELKCKDGCSSNYEFPYFALQMERDGVVVAIGWPGQWYVRMKNMGEQTAFLAGQEYLDTYLYPKEEIRTPMITFLLYDGKDRDRQTNLWRHFFMDCNMPRQNGKIMEPAVAGTSCRSALMIHATEESQIEQIRAIRKAGIHLDYWWMDAGWYTVSVQGDYPKTLNEYGRTGTWEVRTKDFPTKFRAISDCMSEEGGKTLLWFEPERCGLEPDTLKEDGSSIKKEWLLNFYQEYRLDEPKGHELVLPVSLVNLGNPEAYNWLKKKIFKVLEEGKISMYREDHNIRPLKAFLDTDEKNRQGITENKYITGHLRLWDEIREHFDDMILDSCASGGRRNDIESMRRAVPLWYSDFFLEDTTKRQAMQHALFAWFPYFGAEPPRNGEVEEDYFYKMRSSLTPFIKFKVNIEELTEEKMQKMRQFYEEWKSVCKSFYADYYPLIPWNIDESQWIGHEFIDSVTGEGFLQLYRRPHAPEQQCVILKGLEKEKRYMLKVLGSDEQVTVLSGQELMNTGYNAVIHEKPGAITVKISQVQNSV